MDTKRNQNIRTIVKICVQNEKNVGEVIEEIILTENVSYLSTLDEEYIVHKYCKYCTKLLEEEICENIIKYDNDLEKINTLLNEFLKAKEFSDFASYLVTGTKYFPVLMNALSHKNLKFQEETFIRIRSKIGSKLKSKGETYFGSIKPPSYANVISALLDYLTDYKTQYLKNNSWAEVLTGTPDLIIDPEWKSFSMMYRRAAAELNSTNARLLTEFLKEKESLPENFASSTDLINSVSQLMKPLQIKSVMLNGKKILETNKPIFVLSKCLNEIEENILQCRVEEVHIYADQVAYIDTNIDDELWRSKNLVVRSNTIKCVGEDIHWILSGKNGGNLGIPKKSNEFCSKNDGIQGADGANGNNGGNVLLIANNYENTENLTIHTNGGNGGDGVDGTNGTDGKNGKDGAGITIEELKTKFSPPVRFFGRKDKGFTSLIDAIRKRSKTELEKTIEGFDDQGNKEGFLARRLLYFKGIFECGVQYEFSYSDHIRGKTCYMHLKGENGERGTQGGFGGLGGKGGLGGYPGKVDIINLTSTMLEGAMPNICRSRGKNGVNGENGEDGLDGTEGKDGLDVGYADSSLWMNPVYYGPGYYKIYSGEDNKHSVFCRYYRCDRYLFEYIPEKKAAGLRERIPEQRSISNAQKQNAIDIDYLLQKGKTMNEGTVTVENFHTDQRNLWNELTTELKQLESVSMERYSSKLLTTTTTCQDANLLINQDGFKTEEDTILSGIHNRNLDEFKIFRDEYVKKHEKAKRGSLRVQSIHVGSNAGLQALASLSGDKDVCTSAVTLRMQVTRELTNWFKTATLRDYEAFVRKCIKSFCYEYKVGELDESKENSVILRAKEYGQNSEMNKDFAVTNKVVQDYTKVLEDPNKFFNQADINLIAKAQGIQLVWCNELKDAEGFFDEISDKSKESKTLALKRGLLTLLGRSITGEDSKLEKIYISRYNKGFCRLVKTDIECWTSELNKILINHLLVYPTNWINTPIENLKTILRNELAVSCKKKNLLKWSENLLRVACDLCLYFFNDRDREMRKQAFNMISILSYDKMRSDELVDMMLKFDILVWPKEICCILLKYKLRDENAETFLEKLTSFREKFEATRPEQFYHLVFLLKTENDLESFEKALDTISSRSVSISENEYSQLFQYISPEEIQLQHNKLSIMKEVKIIQQDVDLENTDLMKSFQYYLYNIYETRPKKAVLLAKACTSFVQNSSLKKEALTCLLTALQKFYNGNWTLNESVIGELKHTTPSSNLRFPEDNSSASRKIKDLHQLILDDKEATTITNKHKNDVKMTVDYLNIVINRLETKMNFSQNENGVKICRAKDVHLKNLLGPRIAKTKLAKLHDQENETQYQKRVIKILALINFAIKELMGFDLRDTQKYAILATVLNLGKGTQHLLTQIKTGEGKSCVILAVAIIYGILGEKTDIVTSSSVLAERDAVEFRPIFEIFGLTVGSLTTEDSKERSIQYRKTVIYGEVSQLQRDHLVDHFYNDNIRGARKYQNIIIDEVDSMFLDKGSSVLYLSHSPSDLDCLESIFVFVWNSVVKALTQQVFDPILINNEVLSSIQKTICKQDLPFHEKDWTSLFESEVIDSYGSIDESNTGNLPAENVEYLTSILEMKIEKFNKRTLTCPAFLIPFVRLHLLTWIRNAYQATQLNEGIEYVLHTDHLDFFKGKYPKIMILDLDTGTDLKDSQWSDGLHQFLQLKHGCRLSLLTLKSVFISNISYFLKYSKIFGLSGTLGTTLDRSFLQKTYNANFLVVPTALQNNFLEEEPTLCSSKDQWINIICTDTRAKLCHQRSVLILCETINDAKHISTVLNERLHQKPYLYRRDFEPFEITKNGALLATGVVIVATNLAGRGTDIKLSEDLKRNGGLHVIFSYFPSNSRITSQGFGRAGRCGDPGSGTLIFVSDTTYSESNQQIVSVIDFINQRDKLERNRIARITSHYEHVIVKEEAMFLRFKKRFDNLDRQLEETHKNIIDFLKSNSKGYQMQSKIEDVKGIVKQTMLDDWAFWLDEYSTFLGSISNPIFNLENDYQNVVNQKAYLKRKLKETLEKYDSIIAEYQNTNFLSKLLDMAQNKMSVNVEEKAVSLVNRPALKLKLAKYYISKKNFEKASTELDEVLKAFNGDHSNLAALTAIYYKMFCGIKASQKSNEFQDYLCSFFTNSEKIKHQAQNIITSVYKSSNSLSKRTGITDGLKSQKEATSALVSHYVSSIEMIFGKASLVFGDFLDVFNGNQDMADALFKMLHNMGQISYPRLQDISSYPKQLHAIERRLMLPHHSLQSKVDKIDYLEIKESSISKLEDELHLPSVSNFWKEISSALVKSEDMALISYEYEVCDNATQNEGPIQTYLNAYPSQDKFNLIISTSNIPLSDFRGQVILQSQTNLNQNSAYLHHQKNGRACTESVAILNPEALKQLNLHHYKHITVQDLEDLPGVDSKKATKIFDFYVQQGILNKDGVLQSTQLELKADLEIPALVAIYKNDIAVMLSKKCCFEYERLRILEGVNNLNSTTNPEEAFTEISIFLNKDPLSPFLAALSAKNLVREGSVDKSVIKNNLTEDEIDSLSLLSEIIRKDDIKLFFPICEDSFINKIFKLLYKVSLIDAEHKLLNQRSSNEIKSINSFTQPINLKESIHSTLAELDENDSNLILDLLPLISTKFFLQSRKNRDKIAAALKELAGTFKDEPKIGERYHLVELSFGKLKDSGNVLELCQEAVRFDLYGLSHVILRNDDYDKQRNRFSALAVMTIGTVQVAAGLALNVLSYSALSPFGNALMVAGIHDIFCGIVSLCSGKFSWRTWATCKALSTAFTIATLGYSMIGLGLNNGVGGIVAVKAATFSSISFMHVKKLAPTIKLLLENEVFHQTIANWFSFLVQKVVLKVTSTLLEAQKTSINQNDNLKEILEELFYASSQETVLKKLDEILENTSTSYIQDSRVLGFLEMGEKFLKDECTTQIKKINGLKKLTKLKIDATDMVIALAGKLVESGNKTIKAFNEVFGVEQFIASIIKQLMDFLSSLDGQGDNDKSQEESFDSFCATCQEKIFKKLDHDLNSLFDENVSQPVIFDGITKICKLASRSFQNISLQHGTQQASPATRKQISDQLQLFRRAERELYARHLEFVRSVPKNV